MPGRLHHLSPTDGAVVSWGVWLATDRSRRLSEEAAEAAAEDAAHPEPASEMESRWWDGRYEDRYVQASQ